MPSLFYIATGLGFALFLATNFLAGKVMRKWPGRLFGVAMLLVPIGFLLLANATKSGSLGDASTLLVGAGAVFFVSTLLVGAGLVATARSSAT